MMTCIAEVTNWRHKFIPLNNFLSRSEWNGKNTYVHIYTHTYRCLPSCFRRVERGWSLHPAKWISEFHFYYQRLFIMLLLRVFIFENDKFTQLYLWINKIIVFLLTVNNLSIKW